MVEQHVYYLAAEDRTYGWGSEEIGPELKRLWEQDRREPEVTRYDGASTWICNGRRVVRICRKRAGSNDPASMVDLVDIEPASMDGAISDPVRSSRR